MYFTQPLHRFSQQRPDALATVMAGRAHTFSDLADRVARLASGLLSLGMKEGDRVGILSLNSDRYFETLIAIPWAGGVVNPCNTRWSAKEILFSLQDCDTRILFVDEHFLPFLNDIDGKSDLLRHVIVMSESAPGGLIAYESLVAGSIPVADVRRGGGDNLGVFYTGGTTGFPKGVMISHASLNTSSMALMAEDGAPTGSVYLHAAPMFHLADFGISGAHWIRGNTHCFIPGFSPAGLVQAVNTFKVTHVLLVPTMLQMLLNDPVMSAGADLSSLRCILFGASPMPESVLDKALEMLPGVEFIQAYGMTELSPLAAVNPAYFHTTEGRKHGKVRSAGRATFCTEVKVVGPDDVELPRGEIGEVIVRGGNVMTGYWNQPELTADVLRGGWMHTGDAAYMDNDGFLFVVDRVKDMIISGGENIYSTEVENALLKHPAVASCAVVGIPSERWGETVHAAIVLKGGDVPTREMLIAFCKGEIAGYKCPSSIEFVDALPMSGAGKILKTEIRKPFWSKERKI